MNSRISTVAYDPGGKVNLSLIEAPSGCQRSPSSGPSSQRLNRSFVSGACSTLKSLKGTESALLYPKWSILESRPIHIRKACIFDAWASKLPGSPRHDWNPWAGFSDCEPPEFGFLTPLGFTAALAILTSILPLERIGATKSFPRVR